MNRKILLGLLPLLFLLMAVGAYAVALFARLGGAVDVILRENYRSVIAAQSMKETAERMDSGAFFTLAGEEERGRKLYEENRPVFLEHLRTELSNLTVPGERELAMKLEQLERNHAERMAVFLETRDPAARRGMYFGEMLPLFTEIKEAAQAILNINQEHMRQADREARRMAASSTRHLSLAIILGGGVALFFMRRLQRAILSPIQNVTAAVRALGEGNYEQAVPVATRDELGDMADAFNKMARKLQAYRQITDEKLVQARQTTETTFSALPDPILVLAPEGTVEFQNPAATRLLAQLEERELPQPVRAAAERVLKGKGDYLPGSFAEAICVRAQERETFLLPRIVGLGEEGGALSGAAVMLQDVTRLRLLDDVKTNLVSTVSHELKTPLTSVRMGLHLLLEEKIGPLNPQQTELLLAAREDAERLLRMINDLLDLARLESGASPLSRQPISAEELMETARADAEAQAEPRNVRIRWEVEAGLGEVEVEPQRLAHVFANFVSNALKHTPAGAEIVLRARKQGDEAIRFSVVDSGPGIPREYQARIFERFFRVPGPEKGGAGLGLAIAREIVVAHGGHIGVESEAGRGSDFYFVLPVKV